MPAETVPPLAGLASENGGGRSDVSRLMWAQEDAALLEPRPFSPLELFVCSFHATLSGLEHPSFSDACKLFCGRGAHGCVLAVNTNFAQACQPGFEHLLKPALSTLGHTSSGRPRKLQGEGRCMGTCFNSAIEATVRIDIGAFKAAAPACPYRRRIPPNKVYRVQCFPTTGATQISGVLCVDLSDAQAVLDVWVAHLNAIGFGSSAAPVALARVTPVMRNYKATLAFPSPRLIVDIDAVAEYFSAIEDAAASCREEDRPPVPVRRVKSLADEIKTSFYYVEAAVGDAKEAKAKAREPLLEIFPSGKVNILGAKSPLFVVRVYEYLCRVFLKNWAAFVRLKPRRAPAPEAKRPPRLAMAAAPAALAAAPAALAAAPVVPVKNWIAAPPARPSDPCGAEAELAALLADLA